MTRERFVARGLSDTLQPPRVPAGTLSGDGFAGAVPAVVGAALQHRLGKALGKIEAMQPCTPQHPVHPIYTVAQREHKM